MAKKYRLRERQHSDLLPDLMMARGVVGVEAQKKFLEPDFERDSHDPFLLPDMEKAVDRVIHAQKTGEKICVWSDYDADGVPGGVALTEFLRSIGLVVRHYIPHRHKEGYGLNKEGLAELAEQGITLVITVDLGTTENAHIAFAKEKGIDVIVTDHHIEPEVLPEAFALINPKLKSSTYPFDGLCGAGTAWKLIQGILKKNRFDIKEGQEKWLLDLIGIATLSDMVPLVGENRMIARYGLVVMRKARRPGLSSLLSLLKIKPSTMTEDDIGFMVSPRINAASRMDKPETAARLLATADKTEADELARELNHINDERKGLVAATVKEVNKRMREHDDMPVIVMGNPNWRPGILGLVANTLVESHHKPVFLWGREGGEVIRGSVRGDGIVSVVEMMKKASVAGADIFEHYGGHVASGGFSLGPEHVHELAPRLIAAYNLLRSRTTGEKEIILDRTLDLAEVEYAQRDLMKLAPFGVSNEKPLFMLPGVTIGRAKTFGKTNNHLELELKTPSTPFSLAGIAFFSTPDSFSKRIDVGSRADIVGNVELDWRGRPRVRVVDVI